MAQTFEKLLLDATEKISAQVDDEISKLHSLNIDDLEALKEQRLLELKRAEKQKQTWLSLGHGFYTELPDEKTVFTAAKQSDKLVLHFYNNSEYHCKIMDMHLAKLAHMHIQARFVKIDMNKSPFLTGRWGVTSAPTLFVMLSNVKVGRINGLQELGGEDFSTKSLEKILCKFGVLTSDEDEDIVLLKKATLSLVRKKNRDDSDSE